MKVLVTGATGFIGKELLNHLGFAEITGVSRDLQTESSNIQWVHTSLEMLLTSEVFVDSYDVVIHLAGLAHVVHNERTNPLSKFKNINRDLTLELARQLASNGLKRFVFVSSIGVNGTTTEKQKPFSESSIVNPTSPYALSKYEAEIGLLQLSKELNFELVIVRPPLVYGLDAPGNFGKLINIINKRIPLPFGWIRNKRSYVSVANLSSFLVLCATHPKAANETFLISDDSPISTTELLNILMQALSKKVILIPFPKWSVVLLLSLVNKKSIAVQLLDDLVIDNSKAKQLLEWSPIETMKKALKISK
jgi:nucleoside-diphosphate-sugar epimerase